MKKLVLLAVFFCGVTLTQAQTKEELKAQKAEKQVEADAAQGEANAIQAKIDALPGWRTGAFGTIGGSLSNFKNWYSQGTPNNSSGNIGFTVNAYANLIEEILNTSVVGLKLSSSKLDDKDSSLDDDSFNPTTDVFNISSLYGKKLSEKFAISALAEYRTTLLNNFNDPGFLDVGAGGTWTPVQDLIVVIHPLNYNFAFSSNSIVDFQSSMGAKIVADYTKQLGAINFKTNLSMFQSYKSSDLSNWTWTNSFGYTLWKMIGVGFDFGLRQNKQEAFNYQQSQPGSLTLSQLEDVDNKIQSYWTIGLSYKF